ncbi:MAG: DUF6578 domain-containing protein [Candidatus Nanopelagicales bacterium]
MLLVVWVTDWQMECCGAPFAVGEAVSWRLSNRPDVEWLSTVIGVDEARAVTHAEDHHDTQPHGVRVVDGTVVRIRVARCRYVPGPKREWIPVTGSTSFENVTFADGSEADNYVGGDASQQSQTLMTGYIVDLNVGA